MDVSINAGKRLESVFEYLDRSENQMLSLWETLVNLESPNGDKEHVDLFCHFIADFLAADGIDAQIIENKNAGNGIFAQWGGSGGTGKPVMLLGHMDTVFPLGETQKRPFRIEGGYAYGPGALDMKGGLVIALYVLKALMRAQYGDRPVRLFFAGDEENRHADSNTAEILARHAAGCAAAFNFETGYMNNGLVTGRKGSAAARMESRGVAAHSGNEPERGRSAIRDIANKVVAIEKLNDYEGGTTLNVGLISGGTSVNAVPDRCSIDIDIRFTRLPAYEALIPELRKIAGTAFVEDVTTTFEISAPSLPMEQSPHVMRLFEHIRETAKKIGQDEVTPICVGGWSDSCVVAGLGVPVVCGLGVKGKFNHSAQECALVESLLQRAKLSAAAILSLEGQA